MYRMYIYATFK